MLTQIELKDALKYDEFTGIFRWNRSGFSIKHGSIAGNSYKGNPYIRIMINGVHYYAHKLAFLYMDGYLPENEIDHIDNNKINNSFKNLREVSRICNSRNKVNYSNNKSGVKGVYYDSFNNKFRPQISVNNRKIYLGRFNSFIEAVCMRLAAEQCLDWSGCDLSSPAFKYVSSNIKRQSLK